MDISFEGVGRERLASFLPVAISKALDSYRQFSDRQPPEDPKEFSAYHAGCKAAISHVELLFKLAKSAAIEIENKEENQELDALLGQAEQEILQYRRVEKSED